VRTHLRQGKQAGIARRFAAAAAALAAAAGLSAVGGATATAAERPADPLTIGPLAPAPAAGPVRDRVIRSGEPRAALAGGTNVYPDLDGHTIRIRVSDGFTNPDAAAQNLATFLGSLLHGPEIDGLLATIATPTEIKILCGAGALACYYPDGEEIIVSGYESAPEQPPRELVIAHEYGHHIANNRSNKPWSALGRGTKRWSTYEGVCRGIASGRIQPRRYWENPGEAFAEAYAFRRFPDVIPWEWRIARPDQGAFDAILADVTTPWERRTPSSSTGSLGPDTPRDVSRLKTPLDGTLKVSLDGPAKADFDLRVLAPGSGDVLARSTGKGADERLRYTVCGRRAVKLAVTRESGSGAFTLKAARP
jgi:hypothetical protein